jgi:hypothetical protein
MGESKDNRKRISTATVKRRRVEIVASTVYKTNRALESVSERAGVLEWLRLR